MNDKKYKLLDKKIRPTPDNDLFFEELAKQKVSFYKSIKGITNTKRKYYYV